MFKTQEIFEGYFPKVWRLMLKLKLTRDIFFDCLCLCCWQIIRHSVFGRRSWFLRIFSVNYFLDGAFARWSPKYLIRHLPNKKTSMCFVATTFLKKCLLRNCILGWLPMMIAKPRCCMMLKYEKYLIVANLSTYYVW